MVRESALRAVQADVAWLVGSSTRQGIPLNGSAGRQRDPALSASDPSGRCDTKGVLRVMNDTNEV
jgi:hypothetical protein